MVAVAEADGGGRAGRRGAWRRPRRPTTDDHDRSRIRLPRRWATPTAQRLTVTAAVGGPETNDSFTVPAGQIFRLTDMVLQNPQGDSGRIEIRPRRRRAAHSCPAELPGHRLPLRRTRSSSRRDRPSSSPCVELRGRDRSGDPVQPVGLLRRVHRRAVISEIDDALRSLIRAEVLDNGTDVNIAFDPPDGEWAGPADRSGAQPLSLRRFREPGPARGHVRAGARRDGPGGRAATATSPLRSVLPGVGVDPAGGGRAPPDGRSAGVPPLARGPSGRASQRGAERTRTSPCVSPPDGRGRRPARRPRCGTPWEDPSSRASTSS